MKRYKAEKMKSKGDSRMVKRKKVWLAGILVSAVFVSCLLLSAKDKSAEIDEFMSKCHEYRLFNGTVLVAESGKVIYKKSFGPANREWNVPNTVDTKYIIGSISKQFTAMLVLQLVNEGKLGLNDTISKHLPYFPKEKGEKITIHHCLCHTSGYPSTPSIPGWYTEHWYKEYSTEELIKLVSKQELLFEPGSGWEYSNPGYYFLAGILEKVTGQPYEKLLKARIFMPLGMKDSGFYDVYEILPKMASPYEYWNFRFSRSEYMNPTSSKGAGCIYSTAGDMYKWDQALYTEKLLPREYVELMLKPQKKIRPSASYAYGWVVGERMVLGTGRRIKYAEHSGGQPGFNCLNLRLLDDKHLILLFNNTGYTDLRLIREELVNILYGQPWEVSQPVSLALDRCKNLEEIKAVIQEYEKSPSQYAIRRDAVSGLGFKLMLEKKQDAGLEILEFNARQFSDSHWVYESLAEAYLMAGKKEQAVQNLEKLLELNPKNSWGQRKLKELTRK